MFDTAPSVSLRPRINGLVILYYHSCFQASWKCLGGGHPCRARHLVETLQWVWTAQNIPPGHLPLHHRPSPTGEKGKERTYGRENTPTFHLQEFWLVDVIGILLKPPFLHLLQAEFVWHKLSADNLDPDFVERRRVGLENFLLRVASHPVLSNDKIFFLFLTEVSAQDYSTQWPNPGQITTVWRILQILSALSQVWGICCEEHCPRTRFHLQCGRTVFLLEDKCSLTLVER